MTFRIDSVTQLVLGDGQARVWQWRIKGIAGRGIYGSIITDPQGRGLYVLEGAEILELLRPDWPQRVRCLVTPADSQVPLDIGTDAAREMLAAALERAGWGPQVDQRGQVMPSASERGEGVP